MKEMKDLSSLPSPPLRGETRCREVNFVRSTPNQIAFGVVSKHHSVAIHFVTNYLTAALMLH